MDDSCAVCAETLEWVAYGQCGHREVCSTCIARLRFICDDHKCCLCKSNSNMVFVTKALGDYTRVISDFSVFPSEPTEGKVGPYWYHEATEAFFDDPDHYKMIKAMCRLSCILCDKIDEQGNEISKRRGNFRNVEQLKDHLFYRHKLFMCNLCLEGRKIFICEQKLYTREQLNQHINTGDSEVDGSETERGGFMGHPMCEFCRNPFYGENELYTHMSTEHYTCHICHRQHPGHYEYYRNYDELEIHFRRDHILCEDEGCLAKKFIVFLSESELKRHNAMEHGGHMSRSKRNVALQIPTSFKYERSIEQDSRQDRRRRGHGFHSDYSESELTMAVQASLVTINSDMSRATSSGVLANSNLGEEVVTDSSFRPLELLATTDSDPPSRYTRNAQGQTSRNTPLEGSSFPPLPVSTRSNQQNSRNKSKGLGKNTMTSRNAPLEGSSFPPLPVSTRSNQQNSRNKSKGLGKNTMAACLRSQNNVAVLHSSRGWPAVDRQPTTSNILQSRHTSTSGFASSSASTSSSLSKAAIGSAVVPPNHASFAKSISVASQERVSASSDRSSINITGTTKLNHSALTPNLVGRGAFDCSKNNFPPVSETNTKKATTSSLPLVKVEDTHVANKFLVEKIRAGLQFDNDRYAVFKVISGEYRQGLIETGEYVAYVHQFGLSHIIPELARLCPDAKKQEELLEACNTSMGSNGPSENSAGKNNIQLKQNKVNKKGKEKLEGKATSTSKADLADSIISSVRELQSSHRPSEEEVEILSKDGYRSMKGKSKMVADERSSSSFTDRTSIECTGQNDSTSAGGSSKKTGGGNKPRKKTSKFHRVRLGENSPAARLGLANSDSTLHHPQEESDRSNGHKKLPVGGVWRDGGGRKLVAKLQ